MTRFTRHARHRMRLYRLTDDEVINALTQPDRLTPTGHGEQHAWKQIPTGWLRITFAEEHQDEVVITVTIRRHGLEEG